MAKFTENQKKSHYRKQENFRFQNEKSQSHRLHFFVILEDITDNYIKKLK